MDNNFTKLIYSDLTYEIRGVLFKIQNELGRFCNEKQYADAIENKLKELKINYKREETIPPSFEGELKGRNKVDFIIEDKLILELKAKRILEKEDYYQVRRYLDAFNKKLGLLVNFRQKMIQVKRILNSSVKE
jgi:GxxExxY protein